MRKINYRITVNITHEDDEAWISRKDAGRDAGKAHPRAGCIYPETGRTSFFRWK